MSKMIVMLAILAIMGCNLESDAHRMAAKSQDIEKLSESITRERFETLADLTQLLDRKGIRYALVPADDTNPALPPSSCRDKVGESFKIFAIKIHDVPGPKTYRYRIYESATGPLCVETDFAFKNPY